jgi:hypothetical protein
MGVKMEINREKMLEEMCLNEVKKFLVEIVEGEINEDIKYGEKEEWIIEEIDILIDILNSKTIEEAVESFTKLAWDLDSFIDSLREFKGPKLCRQILIGVSVEHEDWWST